MNTRLRVLASAVCLAVAGGLGVVTGAAPAAATVSTLCTGYTGCQRAGMSASGYAKANGSMYWRMYAGHNCTNYVAYRLVRSGLANSRPWRGGGNATNWGVARDDLTNGTPAVGAVAWWRAGVYPAGSVGHVAYVERVVSADEVIVSQDSWGGDFSWARVTRASKGWPSGFIHFNDVPLLNTVAPAIAGLAKVGGTLTVTPGTWNQPGVALQYRWRANGKRIAGVSGATFQPTPAQLDQVITVRVVASKLGYKASAKVTAPTPAVLPGELKATVPPTVSGEAKMGSTLTATAGTWYPQPDKLTLQWLADGKPIRGATATTLPIRATLVGKSLAVAVSAARTGYTTVTVPSAATQPVAPAIFVVKQQPALSGVARPGKTLTLTMPRVSPKATQTIQWMRGRTPVKGATGTTYVVTAADLGAHVWPQVTSTRAGYATLVLAPEPTNRVRTDARIRTTTDAGRHRVTLHATVTASGVSPVTGVLKVWSGGKLRAEATLRNGSARVRITGLRSGLRKLRVVYLQSAEVLRSEKALRVRVR